VSKEPGIGIQSGNGNGIKSKSVLSNSYLRSWQRGLYLALVHPVRLHLRPETNCIPNEAKQQARTLRKWATIWVFSYFRWKIWHHILPRRTNFL